MLNRNFPIICAGDGVPVSLSYRQYKWLLMDRDRMFAPAFPNRPGQTTSKRILFNGTHSDLAELLHNNEEEIETFEVEEYIRYLPNGTEPIALRLFHDLPFILYLPKHMYEQYWSARGGIKEHKERDGIEYPYSGQTPKGCLQLLRRIGFLDEIPTVEVDELSPYEAYSAVEVDKISEIGEKVDQILKILRKK